MMKKGVKRGHSLSSPVATLVEQTEKAPCNQNKSYSKAKFTVKAFHVFLQSTGGETAARQDTCFCWMIPLYREKRMIIVFHNVLSSLA